MIKAICFDLDGVFFTKKGMASFKEKITELGVSDEARDFVLFGEPMLAFKRDELTEEEYWDLAIQRWGINGTSDELIKMLGAGYEIDPEVKSVVETARKNGYKTCICSNNFRSRIRVLQEKFGFLKHFDVAVFSYEVGVTKPDRRIFEELLRRTAVQPEELVYSDDSEEKLAGALELGINAFIYENFGQFKERLTSLGVNL